MRLLLKSFFAATLAAASALPASASETRVVPAGRPSAIFVYYTASSDTCYSGAKPKVHFSGPAHGSVSTLWRGFTFPKSVGKCAGKPMHGTVIIYKPAPGYHGPDKVSVTFSESEGNDYFVRPRGYTVNIVVN